MCFLNVSEHDRIALLMMQGIIADLIMKRYNYLIRLFGLVISLCQNRWCIVLSYGSKKLVTRIDQKLIDRLLQQIQKSLDGIYENPHMSIYKSAEHHDITRMSVYKTLKKNKFRPYKIHPVQELSENDFDHRVEFCEDTMQRIDMDPQFAIKI